MKKTVIAVTLVIGFGLAVAGCNKTAQDIATSITTATQTTKERVKSVQGYAVQLCGYLPYASAVVSIFNSGFGTDVALVGNAICDAVTTVPLADGPGDRLPRVGGVVVRGRFVR